MSGSSPPPASSSMSSRRSHEGEIAFLNHSPTTVANSLPPDVDNKPLARQKRRRTSKEDEEVLKAEYQRNPKPDKAARIEIVSKVALGEKEVQIWFQNKRQNDRRRSRPADLSSDPALMSSSSTMSDPLVEPEPSAPADAERTQAATTPHRDTAEPQTEATEPAEPAKPTASTEQARPTEEAEEQKEPGREISEEAVADSSPELAKADADPHTLEGSSQQHAAPSRTNWISNRRSASFMRSADDYAPEVIAFPHPTQPTPPSASAAEVPPAATCTMRRTHSFVRISTNEDGTARVVTDLDKTPSPPHPRTNGAPFARAAAGLRRSYSAAGLNERLAAAARDERSPKMPRTSTIGRSRDSRTWEFYCDPDARYNTSLTTRAEQEASGSAADAIGLLRANRDRKILQQNLARQNTPIKRHQSANMSPYSSSIKKPRGPMQRASTINGRLQSHSHSQSKSKSSGSTSSADDLPQTDSDKENWAPKDAPRSQQRPRHSHESPAVQRTRRILGENPEIMSQSNSLGALLEKSGAMPRKARKARADVDPEQDEELRAFMGGEAGVSARTTVSSAEEAGCVEGLLKLSQGQWR